ncbi:helix-turn-helix domain-containing protein [Nocardiopsis potens]|uniref:helix-turn-helix domain-containing protein n=1 Tax=Nocardiopsis potens TaxID=1246458 RepID=UPI000344F770|nr:helix-turn-helix transcriptional regulator [Nocardiopsis potens]
MATTTGPMTPFGAELRRLRLEKGWTLNDLSKEVHFSKGHLSKVENGHKAASHEFARTCDNALGAGGRLAALVQGGRASRPAAEAAPDGVFPASPGAQQGFAREALGMGTASILGLGPGGRPRRPALRSPDVLAPFRLLFDQLRAVGRSTGPSAVLPTVVAQTQALTRLAERSAAEPRRAALLLASRNAEYGGWMAQENGDDRAALWWTGHAVRLADAAGDPELRGYALVRRACIAMYAHDGTGTVALARQAQADRSLSHRVRAIAAEREAQGHALLGDEVGCFRSLERAAASGERADEEDEQPRPGAGGRAGGAEDERPRLGSGVPDRLGAVTGWCLYDLGRPADAAARLDGVLAGLPGDAGRARARFGMRLALSHAGAGDTDRACALADELIDDVEAVDSATIAQDVRLLVRTLKRRPGDPAVRNLAPRLAQVLHRPT